MPRLLNFYMDDSGTRAPNRRPLPFDPHRREFFALGGVLINEEDEGAARTAYEEFRHRSGQLIIPCTPLKFDTVHMHSAG